MPLGIVLGQTGKAVTSSSPRPSVDSPQTNQPFWGDNAKGAGGFIPGDSKPSALSTLQGQSYDPNWAAPLSAWSQWDTGTLGGLTLPGLVRWRVRKAHLVDKKKTPGPSGHQVSLLGFEPAEVDLTFQMWTRDHLIQYEAIVTSLVSSLHQHASSPGDKKGSLPAPTSAVAFDIHLPALNIVGINSVYLMTIGVPEPTGTPQMFQAVFKFTEFSPINVSESIHKLTSAQPTFAGVTNALAPSPAVNIASDPASKSSSSAP